MLLTQPFYSARRALDREDQCIELQRTVSRYNLGNIVDQFNDNQSSYELSGGVSSGLVNGWVQRWTAGMRYDRNLFEPTPNTSTPALLLPPDRTLSYPFVGYEVLQDYYRRSAIRIRSGAPRICISAPTSAWRSAYRTECSARIATPSCWLRRRAGVLNSARHRNCPHRRFLIPH